MRLFFNLLPDQEPIPSLFSKLAFKREKRKASIKKKSEI